MLLDLKHYAREAAVVRIATNIGLIIMLEQFVKKSFHLIFYNDENRLVLWGDSTYVFFFEFTLCIVCEGKRETYELGVCAWVSMCV